MDEQDNSNELIERIFKEAPFDDYQPMSDEVLNLLQRLKVRHMLLLNEKSLTRLIDYVRGYLDCMKERDGVFPVFLGFDFQIYISRIYKSYSPHWSKTIILNSKSEADAFDKFYEHMEAYLEERSKK